MSIWTGFTLLFILFAHAASADPVVQHIGMQDPQQENWSLQGDGAGGTVGPGSETTNSGAHEYWNVDSVVDGFRIYSGSNCNGAVDINWSFNVSVRVVDAAIISQFGIGSVFFGVDDGHNQWGWYLSNNVAGSFGPPFGYLFATAGDTRLDYVDYTINLSSNGPGLLDDTADFSVNNVLLAENIRRDEVGLSGSRFVRWGGASFSTAGNANFERVIFTLDPDGDEDGVANEMDNCLNVANSDQRDTNSDGFGNLCDADINNDGIVNTLDLGLFRLVFFCSDLSQECADADFSGNGAVNTQDLGIMKSLFFRPPGPSCAEQ